MMREWLEKVSESTHNELDVVKVFRNGEKEKKELKTSNR